MIGIAYPLTKMLNGQLVIFRRTSARPNRLLWCLPILFGSLGFLNWTPLAGGETPSQENSKVLNVPKHSYSGIAQPFLKAPKPPFPEALKREVMATRNMEYNAIVTLTIDHGRITATPSGGNPALAKHLAWAVQKSWVADPRLSGTFTLPFKFQVH